MNIYWSNFTQSLPYSWTTDIFWYASNSTETNVMPYGQTSSVPIYNISSDAYFRKFDLYIRMPNTTDSCLSFYANNMSYTANYTQLSTSYQKLLYNMSYGNSNGIWMWASLDNCGSVYWEQYFDLKSCCYNCVCSM